MSGDKLGDRAVFHTLDWEDGQTGMRLDIDGKFYVVRMSTSEIDEAHMRAELLRKARAMGHT